MKSYINTVRSVGRSVGACRVCIRCVGLPFLSVDQSNELHTNLHLTISRMFCRGTNTDIHRRSHLCLQDDIWHRIDKDCRHIL